MNMRSSGNIILLNGAPRAGKSSIARAVQASFDGVWINLGVDGYMRMTPEWLQPGIGLRPGGERPDMEPMIALLYRALYASIAAHSRLGVHVVADVGHHDGYSRPLGILSMCAKQLTGLPVLFVGVRCPMDAILARREATGYPARGADGEVIAPVQRWQEAVHAGKTYDLQVDTSEETAEVCAARIRERLLTGGPGTGLWAGV